MLLNGIVWIPKFCGVPPEAGVKVTEAVLPIKLLLIILNPIDILLLFFFI
jgi:hypothetical protein